MRFPRTRFLCAAIASTALSSSIPAQNSLSASMRASIDSAAREIIAKTGTPSASVAVVKDGMIAYTAAYGNARLDPVAPATTAMRYSIGSVSKQFAATCILLLAEEHRLSLDDRIVKWFPTATRAKDISVRQLLNMTSGISDYWPQDYVMTPMLSPTTAKQIVKDWANDPLDFEPGSKYQYSNTNYVMIGLIVEKVSGMPFVDFLKKRILAPLHLDSAYIVDEGALPPADPMRYTRYALGPNRVAPKEGKGWLFAAGELAMTSGDLAKWDIGVINKSILTPASYSAQQRATILTDGRTSSYGLGVQVGTYNGHRAVTHNGEVSGFLTYNTIFPDDKAAVVVFTNTDASPAAGQIHNAIINALFAAPVDAAANRAVAQLREILSGLQRKTIDRSLFTGNANAYFSVETIGDFASSIGAPAACTDITQTGSNVRGGMTFRAFNVKCGSSAFTATTYTTSEGLLEQLLVRP